MYRYQLAQELPNIEPLLFPNKEAALDSGIEGTVYIGHPAAHQVCSINVKQNKETGECTRSVQYIWFRTFWDEPKKMYSYLIETATDGCSSNFHGIRGNVYDAFKEAQTLHADSVNITKYDTVSGEEIGCYGYRWDQKPDFNRCLKELKEGSYNV